MPEKSKVKKNCINGHVFYKSSDCPVCPACEEERNNNNGFFSLLAAPARRALENNGITTLKQLSLFSEKEILQFHGIGKSSLPKLREALKGKGFSFKK